MNIFAVVRLLGLLIIVVGLNMIPPLGCAVYYGEQARSPIFLSMIITLAGGAAFFIIGSLRRQELYRKEAIAVVGLGWLLAAGFGALPFLLSGVTPNYVDAYFECMSGFTTTGASILADVESVSRGILFWRSYTHWLGGMGIIVLFIAVLPILGAGGRHLYRSEVPGLFRESLTPKIKETAVVLWKIYLGLTVAETLLLVLSGLNLFDSLCHTFATLGTGGFSTKNASVKYFDNVFVDIIITIFMFLAAANFALHFKALRKQPGAYFKDTEWRAYTFILLGAIALLTVSLWLEKTYANPLIALRYASFQAVSVMSTTGFATADFDTWHPGAKVLLVILMFIGGCAGSTGGGIKVIRLVTLFKVAWYQLEKVYRPRIVRSIKIDANPVDEQLQLNTLSFFFIYIVIFVASSLIIAFFNIDIITSATSVAATLNNVGPGLAMVGPMVNFGHLPDAVKVLLSLCMVIGRLELFSILVLFLPRFWRA